MNPHLLKEIEHFFHKDLENKTVDVGGWGDVNEAYENQNCTERFNQIENKPAGLFSIK
jgi:inorganic pyrophosphatase